LWIWGSSGLADQHRNEYIQARRTVRLPSPPVRARVRLSADNRYQLFVNGAFVCRGPARCEPRHQAYDEVDLARHLKRGINCIAVLAHHYGESTFQSVERGGWGFLLDGEVRCRDGQVVPVHSNATWKARRAEGYTRRTARYTVQLAFQEHFDAALDPPDWTAVQFDDADWPSAQVYGTAETMPFERLEPRGLPMEQEEPAGFVAITGAFEGSSHPAWRGAEDVAWIMAEEKRQEVRKPIFRNLPGCLSSAGDPMVVLPRPEGRFAAVVLDAGSETAGFLELDVEAAGGEFIDFYYCEHVHDNGDPYIRAKTGELVPMADRYRCRRGRQRHQFFAWKGFRYCLAVFRDVKQPLKVHRLGYTFTTYPVERVGSFECSDPLLNTIWKTGAWTQQLCMHDAYMDCPWREQAQWWGDARVQWRVNCAVFGDRALFARGLRQAAQSQIHNGLTYGLFPSEAHGCILPDYTLVWICSLWDYYFYTADDAPVRAHFDGVVKALTWFEQHAGRDHLCGHPGLGMWLFLDWAPLDKQDRSLTFTLQYLEALQTAAVMARHIGRDAEAGRYQRLAGRVRRAIVRAFWDERGRQFFEGYHRLKGKPFRQVSQQGNAYAILTGVQPRRQAALADKVAWIFENHDRLFARNTGGNTFREGAWHPIASSFFYAYVLEALFRTERHDTGMAAIRKLWGNMLRQGATTWYESWNHGPDVYGYSSACHAWSASPTYHLSEQVGGIRPAAPGFERVSIAPRAFDLDFAIVRTPTPRGPVDVRWQRVDGGLECELHLPRGVTGQLELGPEPGRILAPGRHALRIPERR
jgi:hypothetical protein